MELASHHLTTSNNRKFTIKLTRQPVLPYYNQNPSPKNLYQVLSRRSHIESLYHFHFILTITIILNTTAVVPNLFWHQGPVLV